MGSFGPRTYLVGSVLSYFLYTASSSEEAIALAIKCADATLEKMQWPEGRPKSHFVTESE